jgi:tetratricopeptide (TPR) repeat protein
LHDPPLAKALGEEALSLAQFLGDRAAEARVLWGLLLLTLYGGSDPEQGLAYGRRSLAIARELGLREQIGYTLHDMGSVFMNQERYEEAQRANLEERAAWLEAGNTPMLADSYINTANMDFFTGNYQAVISAAQEAIRISRSIGNQWIQSVAPFYIGSSLSDQGDAAQAQEYFHRGLEIAEREGITFFKYAGYTQIILLYLHLGALDRAEPLAEELYQNREQLIFGFYSWGLTRAARVKLAQGNLTQAQKIHADSFEGVDADSAPLWFMAEVIVTGTLIQLTLGRPEQVLSEAKQLVERTRQAGMKVHLTEALLVQGKALAALEELEGAGDALREAAWVAEEIGQRRLIWQILAVLAEVETKQENRAGAGTARGRAREVINYIADHAGGDELRESFLVMPKVQSVLAR